MPRAPEQSRHVLSASCDTAIPGDLTPAQLFPEDRRLVTVGEDIVPVGDLRLTTDQGYPFNQAPHLMRRAFGPQPFQMIGIMAPRFKLVRLDHEATICKLCAKGSCALGVAVGNGRHSALLGHNSIKIDKSANALRQPAGHTRNDHTALGMAHENNILEIFPFDMVEDIKHMGVGNDVRRREMAALNQGRSA